MQFKLRSEGQFADLAIGVPGEIDPVSGMIVNLADLIGWFEKFQSQIQDQDFSDITELLSRAEVEYPVACFEIFHHVGSQHKYSIRWQKQQGLLCLSALEGSCRLYWKIKFTNSDQLDQLLGLFKRDDMVSIERLFPHLQKEREELISGRIFSETVG